MGNAKIHKLIRVATVAPIMAAVTVIVLYLCQPESFYSGWHLAYSLFFLFIMPLLAYPLQRFIPGFKDKGREGQRNLAIVFAVAGFTLGCVVSLLVRSTLLQRIIHFEYFLSGLLIFVFNKLLHIRLSGHACGVVAPVLMFAYRGLYIAAVICAALTAAVFISSVQMKRHTLPQLLGGGLIPAAVLGGILLLT